jgi:hypothetical protein
MASRILAASHQVGRRYAGVRLLMRLAGLQVRTESEGGELLPNFVLDPSRDSQRMD